MTTQTSTQPQQTIPKSPTSPVKTKKAAGPPVYQIADLEKEGATLQLNPDTLKLGWKVNTSPGTIEFIDLKQPLVTPLLKKIDLQFPTGIEVTARNMKGVTIRDALDAIHKLLKKKADDELPEAYLKGFEWDPETAYTKFFVHFTKSSTAEKGPGGKKSNKKKDKAEAEAAA